MRNFYASNGASCIPYRKEYRKHFIPFPPIDGGKVKELTMGGSILFQQLEYWSAKKPKGFYKFLAKPSNKHPKYNDGDSWVEELGCSEKEFRTCFDQLGVSYKSKKEFSEQSEPFQGRFYCSYVDRINHVTWYFRNHELVDRFLDKVAASPVDDSPQEDYELPDLTPNCPPGVCGSDHQEFTEVTTGQMGKLPVVGSPTADQEVRYLYTETTSKITSETTYKSDENDNRSRNETSNGSVDALHPLGSDREAVSRGESQPSIVKTHEYQIFLDVYNENKPNRWSKAEKLTPTRIKMLDRLTRDYGDKSLTMLQRALVGAKRSQFWSGLDYKFDYLYREKGSNGENGDKITGLAESVPEEDLYSDRVDLDQSGVEMMDDYKRMKAALAMFEQEAS